MKISVALFLLFSLLCGRSFGEGAKKHTFRTIFLDRPSHAPKVLYLFDGSQSFEVDLPKMNFSKVYELPAGDLRAVLTSSAVLNLEDVPASAPTVDVPEGVTDFYLLFFSDPTNKATQVKVKLVDAGGDELKLGETMWFNLSKCSVGGELGSIKMMIKPNSKYVMPPPIENLGSYPARLYYQKPDSDRVFPLCQTLWRHNPKSRSIGFVYSKSADLAPLMVTFRDYRL